MLFCGTGRSPRCWRPQLGDPISTLPEHLHSTFPSYAKIPENTLTEKKKFLFPPLTLITCLTGPPSYPTPFTGRPSHTLSYTIILFLALKVNGCLLESLPVLRLLRLCLSCRCLFSLTFTSRQFHIFMIYAIYSELLVLYRFIRSVLRIFQ